MESKQSSLPYHTYLVIAYVRFKPRLSKSNVLVHLIEELHSLRILLPQHVLRVHLILWPFVE